MRKTAGIRCHWVVGFVGIVSFFSLFFYTGYLFSAPVSVETAPEVAEPESVRQHVQRELRVYDNPTIAEPIMRVSSLREFYEITESLLELFKSVDLISPKTLNVAGEAYIDAAERASNRADTFGFTPYRSTDAQAEALEAKVLPLKHELLNIWSLTLLMYFVKKLESFDTSMLLRRMVQSGHLCAKSEAELVEAVIKTHLTRGENVGRFLRDNVVAPILARQPELYRKLCVALKKDVIKDKLFDHLEFANLEPREAMMEQVRMLRAVGIEVNIVASREGVIEGRPEDTRSITEENARANRIARMRRAARRGRH